MADLIGIQITGLTPCPSLSGTTEVAVQRQGINKAEKSNLQNINNYIVNSPYFITYLDTSINSKINTHATAPDPHGDRAYSSTLVQSHITANDPHGDRAYTNNKITTDLSTHTSSIDPHKDREYTDSKIQQHSTSLDPHGDRSYADSKDVVTLNSSKTYTDQEVKTKVTDKIGVTIAPLVDNKVPNAFINQQVIFLPLSSFPNTGLPNTLYIDTTNNDVYKWNGTSYTNLTPDVDIGNLNLTTNSVAEGTNVDRKYLTSVLKNSYDNKISDIVSKETTPTVSNLIDNRSNNVVTLKTIKSESEISLLSGTNNSILITDNKYKYQEITTTSEEKELLYVQQTKEDILNNMEEIFLYTFNGEVDAYLKEESNGVKYIVESEKILVSGSVGLKGILENVEIPTELVINSLGNIITGKSTANKSIKVFNSTFTEVGTANVLPDTTFTVSLSTPVTNGSSLYVYTIDGIYRSKGVEIISPNLQTVKEVSLLSIDHTGLIFKGVAEKNSNIKVYKDTNIEIGTGTSNIDGFFSITLTEAVIGDQTLSIKTTNTFNTERTDTYVVKLSPIKAPYEVLINNNRTNIKGKCEENSTITVLNNLDVLATITIDGTGVFDEEINIPLDITQIVLFIEKGVDEYNTILILDTYKNETNKPKEILKVVSSEFGIIGYSSSRLHNKTNYEVSFSIIDHDLKIKVKNTDNRNTLWISDLKINKTLL